MGKKLYRSVHDRKIAGVCGGLSEFFDLDVSLIRLGWLLCTLFAETGLLIYILAAIIIPEESH